MRKDSVPAAIPLKGAIIGFGNVAIHAHLPIWKENRHFSIRAVVEPEPDRAALAREILPGARIYADMEALLSHEAINFVDVCTPPCFHANLIAQACRAGLHVFCEKPLVTRIEDMELIQQMAQAHDRVIFSVTNWKYAPLWVSVREIIGHDLIGSVRKVDLSVLRKADSGGGASDWRRCLPIAGGGILLDHGWHHFYLVLSLIREPPTDISARMEFPGGEDLCPEEAVDLSIRFPHAEARLHLTWRAGGRSNIGTITGERGRILIHDDHIVVEPTGSRPQQIDFLEPLSSGSHHMAWMRPVMEAFYQEVMGVSTRGANLAEARLCAQLSDSAYRSHRAAACFIQVGDNDPGSPKIQCL